MYYLHIGTLHYLYFSHRRNLEGEWDTAAAKGEETEIILLLLTKYISWSQQKECQGNCFDASLEDMEMEVFK